MPDAPSWFRLYRSILWNKKTADLEPEKLGLFVRLLALADPKSGKINLSTRSQRSLLGSGFARHPARIYPLLQYFYQRLLLDKATDGSFSVHNWMSRQWQLGGLCSEGAPIRSSYQSHNDSPFKEVACFNSTFSAATEQNKSVPALKNGPMRGKKEPIFDSYKQWLVSRTSKDSRITLYSKKRSTGISFPLPYSPTDLRQACESVMESWRHAAGVMKHGVYRDADYDACKRALVSFAGRGRNGAGLAYAIGIVTKAIGNYSLYIQGSRDGKYRKAYRWTFADFVTRNKHGLLARFSSDMWEETCFPFESGKVRGDRSVDSLLALADRLDAEAGNEP